MKHHWDDWLDRESGLFRFSENLHRGIHNVANLAETPDTVTALMVTSATKNWELLPQFSLLEELTLHEPSPPQFHLLSALPWLKRLRISFFNPTDLEPLRGLAALEEVVLEYVSNFDDLSPLASLPKLLAVHLENLRRVHEFSGLGNSSTRTLTIVGTTDWEQPIDSLDFLAVMPALQRFRTWCSRIGGEEPLLDGLAKSTLEHFSLRENAVPLQDFAWLVAHRPDLRSCIPLVACEWVDPHYRPESQAKKELRPGMSAEEKKQVKEHNTMTRYYWPEVWFLGRGERRVKSCDPEQRQRLIQAHEAKFDQLVLDCQRQL